MIINFVNTKTNNIGSSHRLCLADAILFAYANTIKRGIKYINILKSSYTMDVISNININNIWYDTVQCLIDQDKYNKGANFIAKIQNLSIYVKPNVRWKYLDYTQKLINNKLKSLLNKDVYFYKINSDLFSDIILLDDVEPDDFQLSDIKQKITDVNTTLQLPKIYIIAFLSIVDRYLLTTYVLMLRRIFYLMIQLLFNTRNNEFSFIMRFTDENTWHNLFVLSIRKIFDITIKMDVQGKGEKIIRINVNGDIRTIKSIKSILNYCMIVISKIMNTGMQSDFVTEKDDYEVEMDNIETGYLYLHKIVMHYKEIVELHKAERIFYKFVIKDYSKFILSMMKFLEGVIISQNKTAFYFQCNKIQICNSVVQD